MSAAAPAFSVVPFDRRPIPAAVFEALAYSAFIAAASLAFLAGWLTLEGAMVLTVGLLASLIVLSWVHLGRGRHPVFLFLCTLMLFQGGKLIAYCLGAEADPMRIVIMTPNPFYISRSGQATTLLSLALSAVCLYAPSRWMYRPLPPPDTRSVQKYLPYLYVVLLVGIPVLLYKNYSYYQMAQAHGGYTFVFFHQPDLVAKVPFLIRAASAVAFPVFLAIYTFETRKLRLAVTTILYFAATAALLLLGSRAAVFQMIATLWYITRVKSRGRPKMFRIVVGVVALAILATSIREMRENPDNPELSAKVFSVLTDEVRYQGSSLDVTQFVVEYHQSLRPYAGSYLLHELLAHYITYDPAHYSRGTLLDCDVAVLLNPYAFSLGLGTGGSFVGEAYLMGGLAGVALVSLMLGAGLSGLHSMNATAKGLFLGATLVYSLIWLPRGTMLPWLSSFSRNMLLVGLLAIGWGVYSLIVSIRHNPANYEATPNEAPAP